MDGGAPGTAADALTAFAQSTCARPVYRIPDRRAEGLSAAKWKLENFCVTTGGVADAILAFRTSGSATVTRRAGGESVRKRPAIGSATFVAADTCVRWTVEGSSESLHVYIPEDRLQRFVERELSASSAPRIRDFFAAMDPWLEGYLRILTSEFEILAAVGQMPDALFLAHTEHVLLRHLLRSHSDASSRQLGALAPSRSPNPLRSTIMHRVQEYVDAHLAEGICLQHLADLARMSQGHFLRSFRVASGMTPYRYVLEQRLQKARSMLISDVDPIARIARHCGFRTLSHLSSRFRARFGVSPSIYRATVGKASTHKGEERADDAGARGSEARLMQ